MPFCSIYLRSSQVGTAFGQLTIALGQLFTHRQQRQFNAFQRFETYGTIGTMTITIRMGTITLSRQHVFAFVQKFFEPLDFGAQGFGLDRCETRKICGFALIAQLHLQFAIALISLSHLRLDE